MFTGLVQATGTVKARHLSGNAGKLTVLSNKQFDSLEEGESIAVNGCCLTLEKAEGALLTFHVLAETFAKTDLGSIAAGAVVNLERAMTPAGRFGGHIVSGHIDTTGHVASIGLRGDDTVLEVLFPRNLAEYLVYKGSVALDGVSLTIASVSETSFTVHIIPTTWDHTNLASKKKGDPINIETDMIGKYVRRQLEAMLGKEKHSVSLEDLLKAGF